jgi:hypothetical protein
MWLGRKKTNEPKVVFNQVFFGEGPPRKNYGRNHS